MSSSAPQPPLWFDFDNDGTEELWVGTTDGSAHTWNQGATSTYSLQIPGVEDWALAYRDGAWAVYAVGGGRLVQAFPFDGSTPESEETRRLSGGDRGSAPQRRLAVASAGQRGM